MEFREGIKMRKPLLQLLLLPLLFGLLPLLCMDVSVTSPSVWTNPNRGIQVNHQVHDVRHIIKNQISHGNIRELGLQHSPDMPDQSFDVGVDGDPSFMVRVLWLGLPVCFRVHGVPGDIIRLLQDPVSEVFANGRIVSSPNSSRTYLGAVSLRRRQFEVLAKPGFLHVNGLRVPWGSRTHGVLVNGHRIIVSASMVAVTLRNRNLTFAMMRHHRAQTPNDDFRYMGFYVTDSRGLSHRTHGMLGQFIYKRVEVRRLRVRGERKIGKLRIVSPTPRRQLYVRAILSERLNRATNTTSHCWALRRGGRGIVDGAYRHYLVSNMRNASLLPLC